MSRLTLSLVIGISFVAAAFGLAVLVIIAYDFDPVISYYVQWPISFPLRIAPDFWITHYPPAGPGEKSLKLTFIYLAIDVVVYSAFAYAGLWLLERLKLLKAPRLSYDPRAVDTSRNA